MTVTTVDYYFSPPRPVQKIKITPNDAEVLQIIFRLIGWTSSYTKKKSDQGEGLVVGSQPETT